MPNFFFSSRLRGISTYYSISRSPQQKDYQTREFINATADTIDALGDTIQDIENTRKRLQQEQEFIRADYRKESQLRKDIERELFMVGKFGTAVYCKEFYMSIPIMLNEIGLLNHRESQIMRAIINGNDLGWIAQDYGLTRTRITQIFYKGCRKARELSTIKAQLDELRELKNEMTQMKTELKIMNDELKVQRIAELLLASIESLMATVHMFEIIPINNI